MGDVQRSVCPDLPVTVDSVTLHDGGFVTVHDGTVTEGAVFHGIVPRADRETYAAGLLTEVGLSADALFRLPHQFSGGQRQRVAIASAFADNRSAIILDEPFNWLDPVAIFDVREELRRRVTQGLTLITALHDLPSIATMCHAAIMMADGKVAMALDSDTLRAGAADTKRFERHTIEALRSKRS
mgnify:CR=1 FL=1